MRRTTMDIIYEVLPKDFSKEGIEKAFSEKKQLEQKARELSENASKKD
jgi:hypothetical protein